MSGPSPEGEGRGSGCRGVLEKGGGVVSSTYMQMGDDERVRLGEGWVPGSLDVLFR